MYRVEWSDDELKEKLKETFDRDPTDKELEEFKQHLDIDKDQWLTDNAKSFMQKLVEEKLFEDEEDVGETRAWIDEEKKP